LNEQYVEVLEETARRKAKTSLATWACLALAPLNQSPERHHLLLIKELEAVAAGTNDRLMVFMPPGSAKSTYASIVFPLWCMIHGNLDVVGASHGSELAEEFSGRIIRMAQDNAQTLGFQLISESVKGWRTSNGCVYRAAGSGGSITGRRADLFIIDDPIKGREDADSLTYRDKVWNWYRSVVLTRLKKNARIVIIQTRWHEDDLSGRLLEEMKLGADQWRIISLPAIAEAEDDMLGRKIGEALWPSWEDERELERKRIAVGEREWAALFQQRPRPLEGSLFKTAMIGILPAAPASRRIVRAWDLAATKQMGSRDPDWTVGVKLLRTDDGKYVVVDVVRLRGGPEEVQAAIVNTAKLDGKTVKISLPQDPGQAGKFQAAHFVKHLDGFTVEATPESGDKATRAQPIASQANVGNLMLIEAEWNRRFIDELGGFPTATHDDQVDALSRAHSVLALANKPMRFSKELLARL
jgi:predicted phage terminase large subunit-like protein